MTKQELLKTHFGYDTFREGQEAVIDALLAGKDVLAVMPTGAGKSICYQVPALMMKGITLVISPLISLMKDQVRSLNQAGISAAYLNSSLTQGQYFTALRYAKAGRYSIIYVAPERLTTEAFLGFALSADISMIANNRNRTAANRKDRNQKRNNQNKRRRYRTNTVFYRSGRRIH